MSITKGEEGWFYPASNGGEKREAIRGVVEHVWSDSCVNVKLANGDTMTSVYVPLAGATIPSGYYFLPGVDDDTQEHDAADPVGPSDVVFVQPKITGYRQLSKAEADLMNEGKALADQVGAYIAKLRTYPATPAGGMPEVVDPAREPFIDQRWVSIGATDLQKGFMSVMRGIAQPTSF